MQSRCLVLSFVVLVGLASWGCGSGAKPPEAGCEEAPAEVWRSAMEVDPAVREVAPGVFLEEVGVRALRGCEDLDGPLAAFNWWTVRDAEGNAEYGSQVVQFLIAMGAKLIFSGNVAEVFDEPVGRAPDGTPWIQETLSMPLYPSAWDFAGMISSREYLEIGSYKLSEQDNDDYDFVFMKCFFGCGAIEGAPGFFDAFKPVPTLAHLFNASQGELRNAVGPLDRALRESGLGELYFAGYAWATPGIRLNVELPEGVDSARGFWNDGLILVSLAPGATAEQVLALDAYRDFLDTTGNDATVLLQAG